MLPGPLSLGTLGLVSRLPSAATCVFSFLQTVIYCNPSRVHDVIVHGWPGHQGAEADGRVRPLLTGSPHPLCNAGPDSRSPVGVTLHHPSTDEATFQSLNSVWRSPLSVGDTFQAPLGVPEATGSTNPCVYCVFLSVHLYGKSDLQIRRSKRLTTVPTNKIAQS